MKMLARAALALLALCSSPSTANAQSASPSLAYPSPAYLDGSEQMLVLQANGWKLISFAELRLWASSGTLGPLTLGPTAHTLAYPNVTTPDGTEEMLLFQNGGWSVFGLSQMRAWLSGTATASIVVNPLYASLGYPSTTSVTGAERFLIFQDGRWEVITLSQLQAWAGLNVPIPTIGALDLSNAANSAFIL